MRDYEVCFTDSSGCETASAIVEAKNKQSAKWIAYQEKGCNFSCYAGFVEFCKCVYSIEEIDLENVKW